MNKIKNILLEHSIKPSYHRLAIFQYLQNNTSHPSVDTIYKDLNQKIPSLSKTTVYNTLNTFIEKNLVLAVHIDDNEIRYDYNVLFHGHFKCTKCGSVYDINISPEDYSLPGELEGHVVTSHELNLKGICKQCK